MRQCVVMAAEPPKWAWNPYSDGLSKCNDATELAANLRGGYPDDSTKLREAYRKEVESLTYEHELLLLDMRQLEEIVNNHSTEGSTSDVPPLPPSEEVMFLKKGFDLRVQQFKENCDRVERLRIKLQRSLERDRQANEEGGGLGAGHLMDRQAVEATCTLLKRVKDQDRLIGILQKELEELQYEQALVENHLKKLRLAADHLPTPSLIEQPRGTEPPPSLHSQGKAAPEFKSEWLKEIRFPKVNIPRLPTTKPPIPSAAVERREVSHAESEKASFFNREKSGVMTFRPGKHGRESIHLSGESKEGTKDSEATEGVLPRAFKSLLSFAGLEEKHDESPKHRRKEISVRVTDAAESSSPRKPSLKRGESEARSEKKLSLARSFSALSVEASAAPYERRASRTLPSPRERGSLPRSETVISVSSPREEEPSVSLAKRLTSRTLVSPRELRRQSAEFIPATERRLSSASAESRGQPSIFRKGSRTLVSPRELRRQSEATHIDGSTSKWRHLTRAESVAFLS